MKRTVVHSVLGLALAMALGAAPAGEKSADARAQEVKLAEMRAQSARRQLDQLRSELLAFREQIAKQTDLVEVAPQSVRDMVQKLQDQREQLQLDEVGGQARRDALADAIAGLSTKARDRAQSDSVSKELAKVVDLREEELKRLEQIVKAGAAPQGDVETARVNLATARAELAGAREKASGSAAEALDIWNRQLVELTISQQERRARLEYIGKRLSQFAPIMNDLDRLDQLHSLATQAQADYQKSRINQDVAQEELERQREKDGGKQ